MRKKRTRPYRLAELFCGCGGFSHGFARTGRFSIELGSDISETFCETFQKNHFTESGEPPRVLSGDIEKLALKDLPMAFKDLGYLANGRLDVLLGGPPCEGFSQNKRSEEKDDGGKVRYGGYNKYINDPRNFLVRRFLRVVENLLPKVVLIENVPQILTHDNGRFGREIHARLEGLGYVVRSAGLVASDYGVPQIRKRAFFLGAREDLVKKVGRPDFPPAATHRKPDANGIQPLLHQKPPVTVREAISDLPPSSDVEEGGKPVSRYPRLRTMSDYEDLAAILEKHATTPVERQWRPSADHHHSHPHYPDIHHRHPY